MLTRKQRQEMHDAICRDKPANRMEAGRLSLKHRQRLEELKKQARERGRQLVAAE